MYDKERQGQTRKGAKRQTRKVPTAAVEGKNLENNKIEGGFVELDETNEVFLTAIPTCHR